MRRISAYWERSPGESIRIAELAEAPRDVIRFEWDKTFLNSPYDLSPIRLRKAPGLITLPNAPLNGLPGLFADSVPDGFGNILLRRGLSKKDISPLDMLQYLGDRTMGALTYGPALTSSETWADGEINIASLHREIPKILKGTPSTILAQFISGGSGPNGMRPKIVVTETLDGLFYVGKTQEPGTQWLIKFPASIDNKDTGKLEFIYSKMAQLAGIEVSQSKLICAEGQSYFTTQLFDRSTSGERFHVHTLAGLLNISPGNFSVDYLNFGQVASTLTKDAHEVEKTFRLATFNVLALNQDDHTKNVAFQMNKDGHWKVAPAYDLTYFETRYGEHKMSVLGKGSPGRSELEALGRELGIKRQTIKRILDQTRDAVSRFNELAKNTGISRKVLKGITDKLEQKISRDFNIVGINKTSGRG